MTDIKLTKVCAEAMGLKEADHYDPRTPRVKEPAILFYDRGGFEIYDPLHIDAQAMALVKRFGLGIVRFHDKAWSVNDRIHVAQSTDLNRAICECVAQTTARARSAG